MKTATMLFVAHASRRAASTFVSTYLTSILLTSFLAHAGVVQGTVQEFASGYALSRTVVRLVPVPRADNVDLKQI